QLLAVDAHRDHRNGQDFPREERVGAGLLGPHGVLAAADELGADLLGQDVFDLEERTPILELRDADDLDPRRQKRPASGQRVATAAGGGGTGAQENRDEPAHATSRRWTRGAPWPPPL